MSLAEVNGEEFRAEVLNASVPVVVDFYADWCGPCHQMTPVLEMLSGEWGDAVKVVKVDVEADPDLARSYRISTIPAILLFRDGEVAAWSIGVRSGYLLERDLGLHRTISREPGVLSGLKSWWRRT